MNCLLELARHLLTQRDAMDVEALAAGVARLAHRNDVPIHLSRHAAQFCKRNPTTESSAVKLARAALAGREGFAVAEFPYYQLKRRTRPASLPRRGWLNGVWEVLLSSATPMPLNTVYDAVVASARFRFNPQNPQFQLYHTLNKEGSTIVRQFGTLKIVLTDSRLAIVPPTTKRTSRAPGADLPADGVLNIHETHLESLIAEDLTQVEAWLTLIGRQYKAPPVGRIDLLCRGRQGDIVVIEIKKFRAGTDSIIDQIARYMGWARHRVALPGQRVRGIIIVGKPDQKLAYAASAVPGLSIKCFDLSLRDYQP
jgi:hypothetical protein